jgi:hypothetical protein
MYRTNCRATAIIARPALNACGDRGLLVAFAMLMVLGIGGTLMRLAGLVILIALGGFVASAMAASQADFAGTWTMDPSRSESAHQDVPIGASTVVIRFVDGGLTIETTRGEGGKSAAFHETLNFKLGGPETTSPGDGGALVTGKARWEGMKLIIETARRIQDSTVTTLYAHTLSADGHEMTVDKTLTVQHGYQGADARTTGHGKDIFVRVAKKTD